MNNAGYRLAGDLKRKTLILSVQKTALQDMLEGAMLLFDHNHRAAASSLLKYATEYLSGEFSDGFNEANQMARDLVESLRGGGVFSGQERRAT